MNRFTAKSNQKTDSFLGISCVFNSNEMENFKTVRCRRKFIKKALVLNRMLSFTIHFEY